MKKKTSCTCAHAKENSPYSLTNIHHAHGYGLSSHGVETQKILRALIQLKRMAIEGQRLNVVLRSDVGHVPRSHLTVAEAQGGARLIHIAIDC